MPDFNQFLSSSIQQTRLDQVVESDMLKDIALELVRPNAEAALAFEQEQERLQQACGF
ncbi:hypothetical protein [Pseudomonas sessilinigenes]|uniref:Uncharacterized protein n=1 Tax=Pseudomonas sessilinigenes TaxID=658629 RepID=A0ABX8MXA9_9PSED|nr:hypothetical protein [Pseudomonas sessilinigenes]AZC26611.1 hypothetical protein C4K39_4966 [Pseudomonas sessilinigenes]QXH43889.1 hypothetical protein KSS89_24685 [Pseudomonas sessilinigenes]